MLSESKLMKAYESQSPEPLPNYKYISLAGLRAVAEAAVKAEREGQEVVAWALIWEADGERHVRLYDDETHCVFDSESDGGVCRPLVFAGSTPPAAPVPEQASAAVPDEGKLWSFLRNVLSQGAAIHQDKHDHYERYSARLDAAAAERATELLAMLAASQPEVRNAE